MGDRFTLAVHIRETAGRPRLLIAVAFEREFLDNFATGQTDPPHTSAEFTDDRRSFVFSQAIEARGESIIRFPLTALRPGEFSGLIRVNIDGADAVTEVYTVVSER